MTGGQRCAAINATEYANRRCVHQDNSFDFSIFLFHIASNNFSTARQSLMLERGREGEREADGADEACEAGQRAARSLPPLN